MTSSREIPREVWERHKETILSLRFEEKLPLIDTKTGGRGVIQVMRDEHQFQATLSQYEFQLKKWAAPKNLKKRDWQSILPIYDNLKSQGHKPRVRVGGHVLDESRVKRARRYVKQDPAPGDNDGLDVSSAQTRVWTVEVRQPDGQYTESPVEHPVPRPPELPEVQEVEEITLLSPLAQAATANASFGIQSRPPQSDPIWQPGSPSMAIIPTPQFTAFHATLSPTWLSPEGMHDFSFGSMLIPDTLDDFSWFGSNAFALGSPRRNGVRSPVLYRSPSPPQSQWMLFKGCIESILQNISQESMHSFERNPELFNAEFIFDRLESLLDDNMFEESLGDGFTLTSRETMTMSEIYKRLRYSIANNFAGLEDIPVMILLGLLKIDPKIKSHLFECIRSNDLTTAKPLAGHLLAAVIEAGDDEVLNVILETISGRMNLDQIICRFEGGRYTPIALASYFHNFRIVQKLLSFGASVYVSDRKTGSYYPFACCALTAVFTRRHTSPVGRVQDTVQDKPKVVRVVESLLSNGAGVSIYHLEIAIEFRQYSDLVEILIQAVSRERHFEYFFAGIELSPGRFRWNTLLCRIAKTLENQQVNRIIRNITNVIETCQPMNSTPTTTNQYHHVLGQVFSAAILKSNLELVEYLFRRIRPTIENLTASIHCRRFDLIDMILEQRNCVNGATSCLEHIFNHTHCTGCIKTTPLAEAIRLQNSDLIRRLERYGALDTFLDPGTNKRKAETEFEAAIFAIAEVGNLPYLKQLLKLLPRRASLLQPIAKAIEMGHNEVATIMIIHEAEGNNLGFSSRGDTSRAITAALKKRNRNMADMLLECLGFGGTRSNSVIREAVRWGDKSIVEDLLKLGFPIASTTHMVVDDVAFELPLRVAIKTHNFELAVLLLEFGAKPCELETAIAAGDEDMMRLLLRYGADPADEEAFSIVPTSENYRLLSALFKAFSSKYPNGKKGFGREALFTAIQSGDASRLDALLNLKLDVNSKKRGGSIYELNHSALLLHTVVIRAPPSNLEANQMVCRLLDAGADLEAVSNGRTALLCAIAVGNLQVVDFLLRKGADINRPARRGLKRTPLQQACQGGSFKMVEFLLANGADVNAPPALNGGATALQLAAIQGSMRIVGLLLDRGADIEADPAVVHGRTALEGAAEHGRVSVLNLLLDRGAKGYTVEKIERAMALAEKQGHRGCEKRLTLALFRSDMAGASRLPLSL